MCVLVKGSPPDKHLLSLRTSGEDHYQFSMVIHSPCLIQLVPSHLFEFACLGIWETFS